jgi:hypothetical protein
VLPVSDTLVISSGMGKVISERTVFDKANGMLKASVALRQKLPLRANIGIHEL